MLSNLTSLDHCLSKAEKWADENKIETSKLAQSKLAPDMLDFTKQIYIMTNACKFVIKRVCDKEVPTWDDNETTFEQFHARIEKTKALLNTVNEKDFEGKENNPVNFTAGTHEIKMTGMTYVQFWALPNILFHTVTAYNLLRNAGVPIGKQDFLSGGSHALGMS